MSFGSSELYTVLNVTAVQAVVDSFGTGYAIFSDSLIPQSFTGDKSINFYMNSSIGVETEIYTYTINCRAKTYSESRTIAQTVITAVNRKSNSDCFIYTVPLVTIPPDDDRDNYNTPLEAVIKLRG